ncbi:hypothetical protein CEXT_47951 [Caerostris extrusa]|uniref:Uncharacterized protein n=1 Tax=Caerostris extrusa TaxID=172846 RepID=A0AAV4TBQ4_CAEEX|nr:hypothetical protein CEXT_47951 [Caerostris extrusa]
MFTSTAPCSAFPPLHTLLNTRFSSHQHVQKRPTPQGLNVNMGKGFTRPKQTTTSKDKRRTPFLPCPSPRLIDGGIHSSREKLAEFEEEEVNIWSIKSMINSDYFALIFGCRKFLFHRVLRGLLRSHWRNLESLCGSAEAFFFNLWGCSWNVKLIAGVYLLSCFSFSI